MSNPFFSVVIPAYNAESFIVETLDSIDSQDWPDFEVVVVDDGSKDRTSQRITEWAQAHPDIRLRLCHQENKGIGGARNTGILSAAGTFVAFLDADDRWDKQKLSAIKRFLQEHPDVDFVCHDERLIEGGRFTKIMTYGPYKTFEDLLFHGDCISTSATVVRRNKLLEGGLFSENLAYNGVEDYELWLRLSKICRIEYLHVVLGEYHIHGLGISSNVENQVSHSLNVFNHHISGICTNEYTWKIRRRRALTFHGAGRTCQKSRQIRKSLNWYFKAIREYPLLWKSYAGMLLTLVGIRA